MSTTTTSSSPAGAALTSTAAAPSFDPSNPFNSIDISKYLPRKNYTIVNEEFNRVAESQLTNEQKKALAELIDKLKGDFPDDVKDTAGLIRFLKARKFNISETEKMYRNRMKWVHDYKPHHMSEKDVTKQIQKGKAFFYGRDKKGRPVLYLRTAHHFPNDQPSDEVFKYFLFIAEVAQMLVGPPPYHQFVVVVDRIGVTRQNFDPKGMAKYSRIGDYYPDIISQVYIYGANWLFTILYKIAQTVIDPGTLSKIVVLPMDLKKAKEQLLEYIDRNQLVPDIGDTDASNAIKHYLPRSTPDKFVYNNAVQVRAKAGIQVVEEAPVSKEEEEKIFLEAQQRAQLASPTTEVVAESAELKQDNSVDLQSLDLD